MRGPCTGTNQQTKDQVEEMTVHRWPYRNAQELGLHTVFMVGSSQQGQVAGEGSSIIQE
jgi:hypothetical protein